MDQIICPQCGCPLEGGEASCPECGMQFYYPSADAAADYNQAAASQQLAPENNQFTPSAGPAAPNGYQTSAAYAPAPQRNDWANYIYECAVIFWRVLANHYADASGRASRREFWSFFFYMVLLPVPFIGLICLIPWICVYIRRMHDINRSGWWILCPIVNVLFALKRSDPYPNNYGDPFPAINYLEYY